MSDFRERINKLSPKRLALLALELQARVEALESQRGEAIAIVGLSCRFPGADNADAFWRMLRDGVDAITEIPESRWDTAAMYDPDPNAPGKIATRWGGFVSAPDRFEPQLFGISPREAASMDPQQRLLLEVAWETLEDAGYAPDRLNGASTGVFVGLCNSDYAQMQLSGQRDSLDMYFATGGAHSVAAGRIAYVLGLQGPAIAIDTACSSSLVAVHLAVASLRRGECRMALAGGANLILSPDTTIALSRANMMASDGRCKAFAADANGFVRSEGCGLIALKRLSDALADGDRILATVVGTAANQDGRSNGLTAPNGPSQVAVIRQALRDAGIAGADVDYVETHGTGTSLGDPIEAQALGAALGQGRPADRPLRIGSVKTNIGHAESAAGIAGLIKVILALKHGEIPPQLHFTAPNPHIPWDELPLDVLTQASPWQSTDRRRIAGVSSFGFSGTNAHILLAEAEPAVGGTPTGPATGADRPVHVLTLSARDEGGLHALVNRYAAHFAEAPDLPLADVCFSANTGRARWPHRLAIVAATLAEAQASLSHAFSAEASGVFHGVVSASRNAGIAFLFTGQGGQYAGMGRQLYASQPTFRRVIDEADATLKLLINRSLVSLLFDDDAPLDDMTYTQPALFALQVALAAMWRSWGVEPTAVLGHSAGELAAACVAGVFSLQDGLKLAAARGRLMQSAPKGHMAAVFGAEADVAAVVRDAGGRATIAVINGPEHVVVSGEPAAVEGIVETLRARGIRSRRLNVSVAAHSPLMESAMDALERAAADVRYATPQITVISCVTGQPIGAEVAQPGYWRRHLRAPVRFADAVATLDAQGYQQFIELGPTPTLIPLAQRCLTAAGQLWASSLRQGFEDWAHVAANVASAYVHGVEVDWVAFDRDHDRQRVALPTYPFQRERYWFRATSAVAPPSAPSGANVSGHPLLGQRITSPALEQVVFESTLGATWPAFLSHHQVHGMAVLPSPAYIEMALTGAAEAFGSGPYALADFAIQEALILPETGWRTVQVTFTPPVQGVIAFRIYSRDTAASEWSQHVSGTVVPASTLQVSSIDVSTIQARCPDLLSGDEYYAHVDRLGLTFGTSFRALTRVWHNHEEALGEMRLPEDLSDEAGRYGIHPAFLDSCFHVLGAPLVDEPDLVAYLLIGIERFQLQAKPGKSLWCHTRLRPMVNGQREAFVCDLWLYDSNGRLVGEAQGLQLKRANAEALRRVTRKSRLEEWTYTVAWEPRPLPADSRKPSVRPPAIVRELAAEYARLSVDHKLAAYGERLPELGRLATAYIVRALHHMGWTPQIGENFDQPGLARQLGVVDRHQRLLGRLIEILNEDGFVEPQGPAWRVVRPLTDVEPEAVRAQIETSGPRSLELPLVTRCGESLAAALRGEIDPLQLLFPEGSSALTEGLYRDTPAAQVYNALAARALEAVVRELPTDRPIRVLEIGAGTGATTGALLPRLPAERAEYMFTDVSPLFLARAQERFGEYPFVRYQLLDAEVEPGQQGFDHSRYDVVFATNALHATADIGQALSHARQLLKPGGLLILIEGTASHRWVDITFGLTEGWWRFTDTDVRPTYPLLPQTAWRTALGRAGFADVDLVPHEGLDQVLIVASAQPDPWLILADADGTGQALVDRIASRGEIARLVSAPTTGAAAERYQELLAHGPYQGIVSLAGLSITNAAELTTHALLLTQALTVRHARTPVWFVTRGAQVVPGDETACVPERAALWGLGRVIALEQPELWGGLIDLQADEAPAAAAGHVLAELDHVDDEDQIAWRHGERFAARLARAGQARVSPWKPSPDGSYVITGALGGLGLSLAHWLTEQGARHLVLIGRSGLPERSTWAALPAGSETHRRVTGVQALESLGATVTVITADVADRAALAPLFSRFGRDLPPLRGVFHAAVAMTGWPVVDMPVDGLAQMLRVKLDGARVLEDLMQGHSVDVFVLFSSTTALWGVRGLGHYAAANHALDALAHARRARGLPALSINWGTWGEMRVASDAERDSFAQFGLSPMPTAQALEALGVLLAQPDLAQMAVAAVDWSTLKPAYEARRTRPLLANMVAAPAATRPQPKQTEEPELMRLLETARPGDRRAVIATHVRGQVARVLGIDSARPMDEHQGLFEMGMDSLMSVELKGRLEVSVGRSLPATLTFNYPSVAALAEYLDSQVLAQAATPPAPEIPEPVAADAVVDDLSDESEDELAARLAARLSRMQ